jgi:DNA-binding NarL/FixJ family response regulator
MDTIKLLLAEDHTIVRQGLTAIIETSGDICVVAEAEDGQALVRKYFEFKPDVVLSDVEMPGLDGFAAAEEILAKENNARIVFISMHNTDDYISHAYKMGAAGMISKSVIKGELIRAIRAVAEGQKYFMNKSEKELDELCARHDSGKDLSSKQDEELLNQREKDILELIAEGLKSEEIAEKFNLSKRTVDFERAKIMNKLKIKNPTHLVLYAVQHHLEKK